MQKKILYKGNWRKEQIEEFRKIQKQKDELKKNYSYLCQQKKEFQNLIKNNELLSIVNIYYQFFSPNISIIGFIGIIFGNRF